jgi:PAS domain S-box-containing protein
MTPEIYRSLFEASSLGIVVVDPAGRIVLANPTLATMFGYERAELIGQPLELLLPEALRERHVVHRATFSAVPRVRPMGYGMELAGWHKDGGTFPLEASLRSMEIDGQAVSVAFVVDLTVPKQIEDRLRASEERYLQMVESSAAVNRAILGSLTAHIAVLDDQGTIVAINKAWERFARENGDPDLAHTCGGVNYLAVCRAASDSDVARATLDGIEALLARTRDYFTIEYPCHSPDEERWFVLHATPLDDEQRGVVIAHENISVRKRAQEDLDRFFTMSLDMHCISGFDGYLKHINPAFARTLGYTDKELLSAPFLDFVHPDDRAATIAALAGQADGANMLMFENRYRCRDGSYRWLLWNSTPVASTQLIYATAHDITERKQAEAALQEREAYFRALIEHSADAVTLFAADWTILYASPATTRVLGYDLQALVGRNAFDLIHPVDRPEIARQLASIVGLPGATVDVEARVQHADGSWRFLEGMFTNLLDDPAVGAIVNNYHDITERKAAEEALVEERALLTRRVAERTADLSAANADLARAARLKDEFLASMSHELRTPLNAVLGLSEVLQEEVYGPLTDKQKRSLQSIEASGRHLLELINDILDLAKIGAGKLELELAPIPINPLCEASLRLIKPEAYKKELSVDLIIDPAVTLLHADTRRLKQILLNLLSNAVKFTPAGGAIGLEVAGDTTQQAVHLTVWDTGIGIAQADLAHLFQPFVQLDSRLARQYNGTGLGLALVGRMAEMHGGSVTVESELGVGSRFTVSLPWQIPEDSPATDIPAAGPTFTIRKALIVEASPTATAQLASYLSELDVEAIIHPRGADAVALALETKPDLIILDIPPLDTSGWNMLRQLKAKPDTCTIPVLIVSVANEHAYGLAHGAAGYLIKPFTRQDVQKALQQLTRAGHVGPTPAADAPPTQPTILLAEDNEANITTLIDYLSAKGYQMVVARNGAEAVARAHEIRPALILMDIQMPNMDGLEATRRIRMEAHLADTPIIALTALAMPGDRERCLAAGANEYISKPVSLRGLTTMIETQLQQHTSTYSNPI